MKSDSAVISVTAGAVLDRAVLMAEDLTGNDGDLMYTIVTAPVHGLLLLNQVPTRQFTQGDIDNDTVSFQLHGNGIVDVELSFSIAESGVFSDAGAAFDLAIIASCNIAEPNTDKSLVSLGSEDPLNSGLHKVEVEPESEQQHQQQESRPEQKIDIGGRELEAALKSIKDRPLTDDPMQNKAILQARRLALKNAGRVQKKPEIMQVCFPHSDAIDAASKSTFSFLLNTYLSQATHHQELMVASSHKVLFDSLRQISTKTLSSSNTVVGSALVTSSDLSAGYVTWMIRGEMLLSSTQFSMPAWIAPTTLPKSSSVNRENDACRVQNSKTIS